jgi:hypothetical protein
MVSPQPVLRHSRDAHVHALSETCPTCEQPIPNEKAREIRARMDAHERRLTEAANARAAQKIADEKARIEADANAAIDKLRQEKEEALAKAIADAAAREEAVRIEARRATQAELQEKLAAAEQAKADAEAAAARKIAAADEERQKATAALQALKDGQDALVSERVREARDALEKDKSEALATAKAMHDTETRKLSEKLETLQRQIEKQRAEELGEGAHIKLEDALKAAFKGDRIESIERGVPGADILHTVIHNARECGKIVYESKNSTAWRSDYIAKLVRDQTAAKADAAILATFKFPDGGAQVLVRDGVVVVNPARAVAIAEIVRRHIIAASSLRLSADGRAKKMELMYRFITSPRCAHLLSRIESHTDSLLKLQEKETRWHENHWKTEGQLLQSVHKARSDLQTEIDLIISGDEPLDDEHDEQA